MVNQVITANPWRRTILTSLAQRNQTEQLPFGSVINTLNSLYEKLDSLQREGKHSPSSESTTSSSVSSSALSAAQERIVQLEAEIKELQKQLSQHSTTVDDLQTQNARLIVENCDLSTKLKDAQASLVANKATISDLNGQLNLVRDEYTALQMAYASLETKYGSLEADFDELTHRWIALKAKDADILNEENDKILKAQSERMRKQIKEAVSELVVPPSVTKQIEAIPEENINHSLITSSILPSVLEYSFAAHDNEVNALKWNTKNQQLASGGGDRKVTIWHLSDDSASKINTLSGSNQSVTSIDINDDFLIASSSDFASRIWSISTTKLQRTFTGHSAKVLAVKFLKDSNKVISGSYDRTLKIWDINKHTCLRTLFAGSSCNDLANIDLDGTLVASAHLDKKIRFWDVRRESGLSNDIVLEGRITSLDVSSDGRLLLASVRDDSLKLFDLRMNELLRDYNDDGFKLGSDWARAKFSTDDQYVACGGVDGAVFVWDQSSGKLERTLNGGHQATVLAVAWNPHGNMFVSADKNKKISVWK